MEGPFLYSQSNLNATLTKLEESSDSDSDEKMADGDALTEEEDTSWSSSLDSSRTKPQILLMGLRGSGKSSILKVVFHQMPAHETLFLENTKFIVTDDISWSSFIQFQVQDYPGQVDFSDPVFMSLKIFNRCGALVFVIDAQDEYADALHKLKSTVQIAYKHNPHIKFEVFIHKIDGLSDDQKIECQRDIHQRVTEDLSDLTQINISFYLSTIYDHSVFEAFSKVVQKLVPQLALLENLLNVLIGNCAIEKAFLFDVISKIYIATDSSPVDMQTYELCCDMIKVVVDLSAIYGTDPNDQSKTAFDSASQSIISLNNGNVLWLKQVNKYVALVCLLRGDGMDKRGLIEHNFVQFKRGIEKILQFKQQEQEKQREERRLNKRKRKMEKLEEMNISGSAHE